MSLQAARYHRRKPLCQVCGKEFVAKHRVATVRGTAVVTDSVCPDCQPDDESEIQDAFSYLSRPAGERLVAGYRMLEAR